MINENYNESTAIIILAAGSSSRLGQPKQLLTFHGKTLLKTSAENALKVSSKVIVIIGSQAEAHKNELSDFPIEIIENQSWEKGMGNSLKVGLNQLSTFPKIDSFIIMVCDQPLLTDTHLKNLIDTFKKDKTRIVASSYKDTSGVPALFPIDFISQLKMLDDQSGAKKIIQKNLDKVTSVPFAGGEIDIDTPKDYENLTKNY